MLRTLAIFDVEYFGVFVGLEDVGEVLAVGVGNKYLPEIIPLYHLHDPFHTLAIQPVKNIIKEQDRLAH